MRCAGRLMMLWLAIPALSSTACSSSSAPTILGNADDGRVITLGVGTEADLTLQTIGPGNYGDPVMSTGSITFLRMSYPTAQNPGGPRQLYRFLAAAPGTSDVTIPHLGDLSGTTSFGITIVVDP